MHRVRCDALMFMVVWTEASWRGPSAAARIYELTVMFLDPLSRTHLGSSLSDGC
jgi:hypothetical protein